MIVDRDRKGMRHYQTTDVSFPQNQDEEEEEGGGGINDVEMEVRVWF